MPDLTFGKFYLDLRAFCGFAFVTGRLGLRQSLAPFALFRFSSLLASSSYYPYGKPVLVLDDEDLLALDDAAMRASFRAHFDELGGVVLLQNLNAPLFLLKLVQQHELALISTPFGRATLARTLAAYFEVYAHAHPDHDPIQSLMHGTTMRACFTEALLPDAGRRQETPLQNNFSAQAI